MQIVVPNLLLAILPSSVRSRFSYPTVVEPLESQRCRVVYRHTERFFSSQPRCNQCHQSLRTNPYASEPYAIWFRVLTGCSRIEASRFFPFSRNNLPWGRTLSRHGKRSLIPLQTKVRQQYPIGGLRTMPVAGILKGVCISNGARDLPSKHRLATVPRTSGWHGLLNGWRSLRICKGITTAQASRLALHVTHDGGKCRYAPRCQLRIRSDGASVEWKHVHRTCRRISRDERGHRTMQGLRICPHRVSKC